MTTTATTTTTGTTTTTTSPTPAPAQGRPDTGAAGPRVAELFAVHGRMVLGLCRLLLRDPVEAEDAAQAAFLSAHRALLAGTDPREPGAWLASIARNECRARIRTRMRRPLELRELPDNLADPIARAGQDVDFEAVWSALGDLPRRQRRAFLLRELGGLSYAELGTALGVTVPAVESLLFRARQQLRGALVGANLSLAPVLLRDRLAQLIPGFEPGTVSLLARAAALPVAVKLATAAASVGLVAGGASELGVDRAPRPLSLPAPAPAAALVIRRDHVPRARTVRLAAAIAVDDGERHGSRKGGDERAQRGRGGQEAGRAEVDVEHARSGRTVAQSSEPRETANQLEGGTGSSSSSGPGSGSDLERESGGGGDD